MSNNKVTSKVYIIPTLVGLGLALIINIIYYLKVGGFIPSDPAHWGQYGDFIGGLLNPILGFLNLIVFGYLTYTVANIEDRRNKKEIETQKITTLSQMRYQALNEITFKINSLMEDQVLNDKEYYFKFLNVSVAVSTFRQTHHFLFIELFNTHHFDKTYFDPFLNCLEKMSIRYGSTGSVKMSNYTEEELKEFILKKDSLLGELQKFIIDELKYR